MRLKYVDNKASRTPTAAVSMPCHTPRDVILQANAAGTAGVLAILVYKSIQREQKLETSMGVA